MKKSANTLLDWQQKKQNQKANKAGAVTRPTCKRS
mgnify:CR=1 FL=1